MRCTKSKRGEVLILNYRGKQGKKKEQVKKKRENKKNIKYIDNRVVSHSLYIRCYLDKMNILLIVVNNNT